MANEQQQRDRSTKKATVKVRAFPYKKEVPHPVEPGNTVFQHMTAYRGDEVELMPDDHARGARLNAFLKPGENVEDIGTGTSSADLQFSASDATDTELANWIKDDQPTVQQVVDASEGDAETAERLLAAENAATGNDPRKGVVAGLESVITSANQ